MDKFEVGDYVVLKNTHDYYPNYDDMAKAMGISTAYTRFDEPEPFDHPYIVIAKLPHYEHPNRMLYGVQSALTLQCYIVGERDGTLEFAYSCQFEEEEEYDG